MDRTHDITTQEAMNAVNVDLVQINILKRNVGYDRE